ncbi:MAG: hypothetical protein ACP5H3_03135, partial [Candidatus Aenigmatarchaeota archaeon]
EKKGIKAKVTAKFGEESFDMETKDFFVEVESGLKKDINKLKRKIESFKINNKENKKLLIIVPNSLIKKDYEKLSSEKVKVLTLNELENETL